MGFRSFLAALIFISVVLFSQRVDAAPTSGQLTVKVVDGDNAEFAVVGAVVELKLNTSTTYSLYYTTDGDGVVEVPVLKYGDYTLIVSYLGYENYSVDFTLSTPFLELSDIAMVATSLKLDEVVKEIKALRTSQSGDSLQYSASAYKVTADADVEGLLQKMPGITIDDGQVTAQGEVIKKIYIDGREFFGSDVATAIKSLPAEVVDKIELYNKLSDDAEATGMDDGEGSKTINIITKPDMREGLFGKLFAGVGYEPAPPTEATQIKYMGGGSLNIFKGKSRTSIIALVNNLNQQNFSFEDIMGATDEGEATGEFTIKALPGVATVNALGINYSNEFGEKEKVKLQGSYFFNQTTTTNTQELMRWYAEPATQTIDSLWQSAYSRTSNMNNRLTGRIDVKVNDRQTLMIRPTLSLQSTNPLKESYGIRYDDNTGSSYEDGMQQYSNSKLSEWGGYNAALVSSYRIRLGTTGRILTFGFNGSMNSYDTDAQTTTDPNEPNYNDNQASYTFESTPTARRNLVGSVTYIEPIYKRLKLNITYKATNTFQESDKRTYDTDSTFEVEDYDITKTTNFAQSSLMSHNIGAGFNLWMKGASLTSTVYYQNSSFDVNTLRTKASNGSEDKVDETKHYENVTYSLVSKIKIDKENSLRVYLTGNTTAPPIARFTDNTSSSSYIVSGNSDLNPQYTSRLRLFYTHTNIERGSTLMFNCNAMMTSDYIASHIVLDPGDVEVGGETYDDLQSYSTWVNIDNLYKLDSNISFGMPLDFVKCNLNFNGGVSYQLTPSLFGGEVIEMGLVEGGERIDTESMTYIAGVTLGSNISENIDFTLSWRGNYNEANSLYNSTFTKNNYFNQIASANMKFVFLGGFTLTSNVAYRQYRGITNNYNDDYVLVNAFIGHKIMRHSRGEITFGVNDILNQNTSISRSVASTYTQSLVNTVLGRYFSLQFIYNLRAFGKAK